MKTSRAPLPGREGFTALPRRLLDWALCWGMGKRELHLWLLVARLTYGAQGREWTVLRPSDLITIGIGPNHARACLQGMCKQELLLQNGDRDEYRVNTSFLKPADGTTAQARQERLRGLVARQLGSVRIKDAQTSQTKKLPPECPRKGSNPFPKGEGVGSHPGNVSTVPAWRFSRSLRRFVYENGSAIDSVKTGKDRPLTPRKEAP